MKTILALTDFSSASLNAVNYAADIAVAIQAKLILLHVIPYPIAISEISVPVDFIDDMTDAGEREIHELQKDLLLRTESKIVITTSIKLGFVENKIDELASEVKPLAIVLGIRSGRSFERSLLGSTIFHVMNRLPYPSLIIPENVHFEGIHRIGMACDLKAMDTLMPIEMISEWVQLFHAELEIINIANSEAEFKTSQMSEAIGLQNRLNHFKPHFHFLSSNHISEELNEFLKNHPMDLMIVFPRSHSIFNLFHKRKSRLIVSQSQLPILSIHDIKPTIQTQTSGNKKMMT